MSGIGYKAFGVASKDVNAIGQIQTKLTTIEFGFSPFIPFTKQYSMAITEGVASGTDFGTGAGGRVSEDVKQEAKEWIMGPGGEGEPKAGKWLETLQAWREANYDLETLVERQPTNMQRERANLLSDYLSKLFESESITSKYEGTVKGEVMEQSVTDAALNMSSKRGKAWKNRGFDTPNTVVDKLTQGGGFSDEQIDLTYIDDFQQGILDYSHHRLAANFGNDMIKGSLGIETTDMAKHKTFQHSLFDEYGMNSIKTAKQVEKSVAKDVDMMLDAMNAIGGNLQNQYDQLLGQGQFDKTIDKGAPDPYSYTAAQILDRFRKIEASQHQMVRKPLYDKYLYQMPIGGAQYALIALTPTFSGKGDNLRITKIDVKADVLDMSDAPPWLKQYFNTASDYTSVTGLHANFLLYDMWKNSLHTRKDIELIARKGSMDAVNHLALGIGKAGELVGTSLETETALFPIEALGKAPVVSTVEILGTKELAESLKLQVLGHFQGAETQISAWYRDAMSASYDLTQEWKKRAKDNSKLDFWGKPYDTASTLSRTGTPFFMTMGRDISAYKLFKNRIADRTTWERAKMKGDKVGFFDPAARVLYAPGAMKRSESFNVTPKLQAKYAEYGVDVPLGTRQAFRPNIPKWV